tara:strand:+ start:102386 stop:102844 length:459 start_codon:yes stop_codon:yes gene_type:complete
MSIPGLLARGIRTVLDDPEAETELAELVAAAQLPSDATEHVRQTLEAMPGLLVAIERSIAADPTSKRSHALFDVVVRYALEENDLIPSHAGKPVLGLLDDVYLLHLVAYELRENLLGVSMHSVAGGAALLESILARSVTQELSQIVKSQAGE